MVEIITKNGSRSRGEYQGGVKTMRLIGIKDLYKQLSAEVKDLPFGVTRNGELIAVVSAPPRQAV